MPIRPPKMCAHPGCGKVTTEKYCERHRDTQKKIKAEADKNRESAYRRGYDKRWQRTSKQYLREHPFCVMCQKEGILKSATEVDHVIPHRGNIELFWDESNWQGLCHKHHSGKTAKEDGGFGNKARGEQCEK